MSHARIEEVEDSEASDPSEGDIDDFDDTDIVRRATEVMSKQQPKSKPGAPSSSSPLPPAFPPMPNSAAGSSDPAIYAGYRCLYPVYFDAARTRAEGRRVGRGLAVKNPLAADIAAACQKLRLAPVLEATKIHPKDWANPGRVRVLLGESAARSKQNQRQQGQSPGPGAGLVRNKHHLYLLVAQHLRENPTTESSLALRMRLPGAPPPEEGKPYPRPAVPRGWKMNELLPYYSPAMTGGGVSENFLQDMMKEMQGGGGGMGDMASMLGGGGGPGGGEEKKKKDRKGKGKS